MENPFSANDTSSLMSSNPIWKPTQVKDFIQGTYKQQRTTPSKYRDQAGNIIQQVVYDLVTYKEPFATKDGTKVSDTGEFTVFSNVVMRKAMADKEVRPGMIVRITFEGAGKPKPGQNPANLFTVAANPTIVDKEFLALDSAVASFQAPVAAPAAPAPASEEPFQSTPRPATTPVAAPSKEDTIKNLAIAKIPGVTEANWKQKVMEVTQEALISANYDKIIAKLQ